jgi:serine/threonine protein phosphatase PrpC
VSSILKKIFRKNTSVINSYSDLGHNIDGTQNLNDEVNPVYDDLMTSQIKSMDKLPQLIVGVAHSNGLQRDHNEDAMFSLTTGIVAGDKKLHFGLYIIADGMGGHENGEIASSVAVDRLASHVIRSLYLPLLSSSSKKVEFSIQEVMYTGVIQAHQTIKKEALGGGTTLTSALILGDQLTIAHVGDSRAYFIEPPGNLRLLTHDHSVVKRLEEIGQISAEQAITHPQRNVLYRALGQGEPLEPDIATYPFPSRSQVLLCSDGLWGVITERDIEAIIQKTTEPQNACQAMIDLANSAGGPDNISAILVRIPG